MTENGWIIVQTTFDSATNEPRYQLARPIQGRDPVYSVALGIAGNEPTDYQTALRRLKGKG